MSPDADERSAMPKRSTKRMLRDGALWVAFFSALAVPLSYVRS